MKTPWLNVALAPNWMTPQETIYDSQNLLKWAFKCLRTDRGQFANMMGIPLSFVNSMFDGRIKIPREILSSVLSAAQQWCEIRYDMDETGFFPRELPQELADAKPFSEVSYLFYNGFAACVHLNNGCERNTAKGSRRVVSSSSIFPIDGDYAERVKMVSGLIIPQTGNIRHLKQGKTPKAEHTVKAFFAHAEKVYGTDDPNVIAKKLGLHPILVRGWSTLKTPLPRGLISWVDSGVEEDPYTSHHFHLCWWASFTRLCRFTGNLSQEKRDAIIASDDFYPEGEHAEAARKYWKENIENVVVMDPDQSSWRLMKNGVVSVELDGSADDNS